MKTLRQLFENVGLVNESEVVHSLYLRSHGKHPKGAGSWFFSRHENGIDWDSHKNNEDHIQVSGKYGDAKRAAKKWAGSKGHKKVYTCP